MERYLIDTNVVSDYFSASLPDVGIKLIDEALENTPIISVITQIELMCWRTKEQTQRMVNDFIRDCRVLNISEEVIEHCVKIRLEKKIKTPDAVIAATALAHGLILITNNEKDFTGIKGLTNINPYTLT